jgi:hypothetical protein
VSDQARVSKTRWLLFACLDHGSPCNLHSQVSMDDLDSSVSQWIDPVCYVFSPGYTSEFEGCRMAGGDHDRKARALCCVLLD